MFSPLDAYAASFRPDGAVIGALDDPGLTPTVIVNFVINQDGGHGDMFDGVFHNDRDQWEIFDSDRNVTIADRHHPLYDYAEQTVQAFASKLLAGPCPNALSARLTQKLVADMTAEIDRDIIRDLQNCQSDPIHIPDDVPQLTLTPPEGQQRVLKVRWTKDNVDSLKSLFGSKDDKIVIMQSTIFGR